MPRDTVPKCLRPHLMTFDADGKPTGVQADRYFYEQLSFCDVADALRFVNQECRFLSALTPL